MCLPSPAPIRPQPVDQHMQRLALCVCMHLLQAEREDCFYQQLLQLQRFWKVRGRMGGGLGCTVCPACSHPGGQGAGRGGATVLLLDGWGQGQCSSRARKRARGQPATAQCVCVGVASRNNVVIGTLPLRVVPPTCTSNPRCWCTCSQIHLNPKVIDCPFVVDLSLPEPASTSGAGGPDGGAAASADAARMQQQASAGAASSSAAPGALNVPVTGNVYSLGSQSLLVPLIKGEDGSMRVLVRGACGTCARLHVCGCSTCPRRSRVTHAAASTIMFSMASHLC